MQKWKERYSRYYRIVKTNNESQRFQIDCALGMMGETAEKVVKLFPAKKTMKYFKPELNRAHSTVTCKLDSACQPAEGSNEAYIREQLKRHIKVPSTRIGIDSINA